NILFSGPASASDEPAILGRCQLSSANRTTEDRSVTVLSTTLCFAHGELTSSGWPGPRPPRPVCPSSRAFLVAAAPRPVPSGGVGVTTLAVFDGFCTPLNTWS